MIDNSNKARSFELSTNDQNKRPTDYIKGVTEKVATT